MSFLEEVHWLNDKERPLHSKKTSKSRSKNIRKELKGSDNSKKNVIQHSPLKDTTIQEKIKKKKSIVNEKSKSVPENLSSAKADKEQKELKRKKTEKSKKNVTQHPLSKDTALQEKKRKKRSIIVEKTKHSPEDLTSYKADGKQYEKSKKNVTQHPLLKDTALQKKKRNKRSIIVEKTKRSPEDLTSYKADGKQKKRKKKKSVSSNVCKSCHCLLSETVLVDDHPKKAVYEYSAIYDKRVNVLPCDILSKIKYREKVQIKLTEFSIYDKENHLCSLDLIEKNVNLKLSGYVKAIDEEDQSIKGAIAVKDVGPLSEWWVCGYDSEESLVVGLTTDLGYYYLAKPKDSYAPFMKPLLKKVHTVKLVISFLLEETDKTFENLLSHLQSAVLPSGLDLISEEFLLQHAKFICEQVASFEYDTPDDTGDNLLQASCIQTLGHYVGFNFNQWGKAEKKSLQRKDPQWSKAVTTPLVKKMFETCFPDQMELDGQSEKKKWSNKCGVCEACQRKDCGSCLNCRKMIKFGGDGDNPGHCLQRKCKNISNIEGDKYNSGEKDQAMNNSEEDDSEMSYSEVDDQGNTMEEEKDRSLDEDNSSSDSSFIQLRKQKKQPVSWIGDITHDDGKRQFYGRAKVGDVEISPGDHVSVMPANPKHPLVIGKISYMWENSLSQKFMHITWYCRSNETVLGETGDEFELFQTNECENSLINGIQNIVTVLHLPASSSWAQEGGKPITPPIFSGSPGNEFFYRFRYDNLFGRIEDAYLDVKLNNSEDDSRNCSACERRSQEQKLCTPTADEKLPVKKKGDEILYGVVHWQGEEYRPGACVLLQPTAFNLKQYSLIRTPEKKQFRVIDQELYSEYYRKTGTDHVKGSNESTPQPFCIGIIKEIFSECEISEPGDIFLRVWKFYRPDNIMGVSESYDRYDLNMLYYSNEEKVVDFLDVVGKCFISYDDMKTDEASVWAQGGPNRFYFSQGYDMKNKTVIRPNDNILKLIKRVKGKLEKKYPLENKAKSWPTSPKVLNCMDVFAGCGGLSEGLHQSGLSVTKWAIEKVEDTAKAFELNYPSATVYNEDCNSFLKLVLEGEKSIGGKAIPQKGEVELLVGGPPCQGFSGVNRFNKREYSLFKNSLVVTFLSFCDYYRPKFFVFENVSKFVSFKNCMVIKLMLACLTKMGYQVTYGVLQAGSYGIPQSRRRAIIMAAAPGETLPKFPEPTHTFNLRSSKHSFLIDSKEFTTNCEFEDSAPYRTVTVYDAISDLPPIENGADKCEIPYEDPPKTHYQKLMRGNQTILKDHICKDMPPLALARITRIPTVKGSDWRDLPNITMKLSSDIIINKLEYTHDDIKNGKSPAGALRGVCTCASGDSKCDPKCRQFNTLIPWSLPHTGNRQNNWIGIYGRLEWEGYFSTTMTNPEPMNKQGRVLHPTQSRIVSVRECARSQGFPDSFQFYGNILAKHRQIGNAVPPPLACALGREIIKSLVSKMSNENRK